MKYVKNEIKIKELFNKLARNYDKNNNVISFGLHNLIKKDIVKKIEIKKNATILDLCTGTGDIIDYILKQYNPKRIVGVDFSSKMLTLARKRFKNIANVKLINANATCLPFCYNTFDYLTISFGFRNIKHKTRALKEMKRVLKPNGKFLLKSKDGFYSPSELIEFFKTKGFCLEKRVDYLFGIISLQIYKKN